MTRDELQGLIVESANLEEVVITHVIDAPSPHFDFAKIERVRRVLSTKFGLLVPSSDIHVVGSAKLGFSLFEKRLGTGDVLEAFRTFRAESDIDIAITNRELFEAVWSDLSIFVNGKSEMPWNSLRLGDYFLYGWIRPDHFPKGVRIRRCDDWWDTFRALSADASLGRRKRPKVIWRGTRLAYVPRRAASSRARSGAANP